MKEDNVREESKREESKREESKREEKTLKETDEVLFLVSKNSKTVKTELARTVVDAIAKLFSKEK